MNDIKTRRRNPAYYITLDKLLGYNIKEKYLIAPFEENLNNPIIQMEIIKHHFYEELFKSIDIITDEQVITEILTNRIWQKPNLKLYEGSIQNIKITSKNKYQLMDIELKDNKTKQVYDIKGYSFPTTKDLELYKRKVIEPNKNNIIAIVELDEGYYPRLICFMKSYSSADIESTYNIYQKHLEELPTIWNEDYSSIENVPDNIITVTDSNIKKYVNNEMARNYIVNGVMRAINNRQVIDTITNEEIVSLVEEYNHIIDMLKARFNQYAKELNKEPDNLIMVQFFDLVYKRNLYKCSTYSELKDLIKRLYEVQGGVKYAK